MIAVLVAGSRMVWGQWNLYVGDRKAVFDRMNILQTQTGRGREKGKWKTVEERLRKILVRASQERKPDTARIPRWKQELDADPDRWNVTRALEEGGKPRCLCRVAVNVEGMVGLDIYSHTKPEQRTGVAQKVIWKVNELTDKGTKEAKYMIQRQEVVDVPTGGQMFFYMSAGAMWTHEAGGTTKACHHEEAGHIWGRETEVQGKVALLHHRTYKPTMDPQEYTQCYIPLAWRRMLTPGDDPTSLDLSRAALRAFWAVGGSWTEKTKVDVEAAKAATERVTQESPQADRECVVCGTKAEGTPRHVQMGHCIETREAVRELRRLIEIELRRKAPPGKWIYVAEKWWQAEERDGRGVKPPPPDTKEAEEFPILAAWRWHISAEEHETDIQKRGGTRAAEGIMDLGYRAVVPAVIARILGSSKFESEPQEEYDHTLTTEQPDGEAEELEKEGPDIDEETWAQVRAAEDKELPKRIKGKQNYRAHRLGTLLVLGNRHIRSIYQQKTEWWLRLRQAGKALEETAEHSEDEHHEPTELTKAEMKRRREQETKIQAKIEAEKWAGTRAGYLTTRYLRWNMPTLEEFRARVIRDISMKNIGKRTGLGIITQIAEDLWIPINTEEGPTWGAHRTTWVELDETWQARCTCKTLRPVEEPWPEEEFDEHTTED